MSQELVLRKPQEVAAAGTKPEPATYFPKKRKSPNNPKKQRPRKRQKLSSYHSTATTPAPVSGQTKAVVPVTSNTTQGGLTSQKKTTKKWYKKKRVQKMDKEQKETAGSSASVISDGQPPKKKRKTKKTGMQPLPASGIEPAVKPYSISFEDWLKSDKVKTWKVAVSSSLYIACLHTGCKKFDSLVIISWPMSVTTSSRSAFMVPFCVDKY